MKLVRLSDMQWGGYCFRLVHPEEGEIAVCIEGKDARVYWKHGFVHIRHPRTISTTNDRAARIVNDLLRDRADAATKDGAL